MQYPLYVHREGDTSFRGNFPDSPRAVAHGKSMDELKVNAKQAVESMYDGSEQRIPAPTCSASESHASQAIGIQVSLLQQVDLAARERHMTRSALITLAVVHELAARYEGQLSCVPVSQRGFVNR
jgi:predicted RNase H-like HicB family nuclease